MNSIFQANQLDGAEIEVNQKTKELCSELYTFVTEHIPDSKEREAALNKLEECAMWATKAVAFHGVR